MTDAHHLRRADYVSHYIMKLSCGIDIRFFRGLQFVQSSRNGLFVPYCRT